MKSKKNLVLVGMMGSGKSTIGKLLSEKLNLKFYDIDKIIEFDQKMKIAEIFTQKGEKIFRDIEEKTTIDYLDLSDVVISLGGGSFLNENIRKKAVNKSKTFWLNWNSLTLISRIKKSKKRPIVQLLNDKQINDLIIERSKIYSKANHKINCEKISKLNIIKKISNLYENEQNNNKNKK